MAATAFAPILNGAIPTAQSPAPVAQLHSVIRRYGSVTALDNLSLALHPGEIVALLGPNGAGKTTAVRLLLGLIAPTSGTVRVMGRDPRDSQTRTAIGTMLQITRVPETLRVREHIDLFRSYYPNPLAASEIVRLARLKGLEDTFYGKLSGGQKQRVLFGLALAGNPSLVFLDEPTVGLDIESRRALWDRIRELAARGKTVLLTTHYLEEADALARRIVVIGKGKILAEGTPSEIKHRVAGRRIRCITLLGLDFLRPAFRPLRRAGPRSRPHNHRSSRERPPATLPRRPIPARPRNLRARARRRLPRSHHFERKLRRPDMATAATTLTALQPQPLGLRYYARVTAKETRYEFLKMMRAKVFSLSVIGFPVMFYMLFGLTNKHSEFSTYLLASYSCFGMFGAALFGLGAGVAMERAQGWLELKQASPMPRIVYLFAKTATCAAIALITVALLLILGTAFAGVSMSVLQIVDLLLITLAGAVPFAALGLLISFVLPPNAGPGMINIIYLPMSFASGMWMPISTLPHWLQKLAPALPTYHYTQLALNIFGYAQPGASMSTHWNALVGFTCLLVGAAWLVVTRSEAKA